MLEMTDVDGASFSWVAIERMVERQAATDRKYGKTVAGRPRRSTARKLSDDALLERLQRCGLACERAWLGALIRQSLSAEAIARSLEDRTDGGKRDAGEVNWIWLCLAILWERWFPDEPSFEKLDDAMQAGYEAQARDDAAGACRIWLDAWEDVVRLRDKARVDTVKAFDDLFKGTEPLFNWMQDLEIEMYNAGLEDSSFFRVRIALIEEGFPKFGPQSDLTTENWKRAVAESYFALGETRKADELYAKWLEADPCWGWGWIGWSDCYRFVKSDAVDPGRCEEILKKGLAVEGVRDPGEVVERLTSLYKEQGRNEEALALRRESRRGTEAAHATASRTGETERGALREKATLGFGDEGLPLDQLPQLHQTLKAPSHASRSPKVGRNEPCPCGSGKKYKKCCGR